MEEIKQTPYTSTYFAQTGMSVYKYTYSENQFLIVVEREDGYVECESLGIPYQASLTYTIQRMKRGPFGVWPFSNQRSITVNLSAFIKPNKPRYQYKIMSQQAANVVLKKLQYIDEDKNYFVIIETISKKII